MNPFLLMACNPALYYYHLVVLSSSRPVFPSLIFSHVRPCSAMFGHLLSIVRTALDVLHVDPVERNLSYAG